MNSQRLSGIPMETARGAGRARLRERRAHGVGHAPGAPRAPRRPGRRAPHAPEPDPGDLPGGGRRLRREVRHVSGRRDGGRARAAAQGPAAVDREPGRAHDRHHARPRPDDRSGGGGGRRGPHQRPPHARGGRHRRLPDLHVHPRPHADDGRGRVPREERGAQEHVRVHQHHVGRRLPRRGPAGGRLLPRAAGGLHRDRAGQAARRRSAGSTSSRRARSPTRRPPGRTTTAASTTRALAKSLEVSKYTALRAEQRERIETKRPQAARHRHGLLRRDVRLRAVRERDDPGGAERDGDRLSPAPRRTGRGTRPRSPRSSPIIWAWTSTRWWCATATPPARRWASAPAAAAAWSSAARPW